MDLIMTTEEKSLARLEAQYISIKEMIVDLKKSIPETVAAAITKHTLDCINQKQSKKPSYPPTLFGGVDPRVKSKLVNTIIAVLSTVGTIIAMKYGLGG